MPGIRIPFSLRKHAPAEAELTFTSPGVDGTAPQPPLTYDDPRLRAFLSVTFDVLYDFNIQTGAVYFSEQLDHMLGLTPGRFPRTLEGWLEHLHPDDERRTGEAVWRSIAERSPFRCEYRLRHGGGGYRRIDDQGVILVDGHGEPSNMIGAMRDVTAEREAELAVREATELQRVLFRLPSPAMHVDATGRYLDADDRALAFFERTRDEMLRANVQDDFPPEVFVAVSGELEAAGVVELDVACSVKGATKDLLLTVIPTHLGDHPSYFLLGTDISEQRAMQEELTRSERALRRQATILDERNTALRVLLEQREQDRRELEQRVVQNVEQLIEPTLDRLSRALRHRPERLEVEAVRVNLREIVGPFAQRIAGAHGSGQPLTRRETEVANLVRLGKSSAEIAEALHISASSVAFHRANVRRKLGLPKGGPRLGTHLAALGKD
jgi:PAS domain-containing protein/DNA-binding CsgD family transcriptional regulator